MIQLPHDTYKFIYVFMILLATQWLKNTLMVLTTQPPMTQENSKGVNDTAASK